MKKVRLLLVFLAFAVMAFAASTCFAEPLVTSNDMSMVTDFGNSLKESIPIILLVIVPVSLAIWVLPTAVKKGIAMMKSAFRKI